ncbi:MAG TPA: aminopeptidase P family protein [Spirochaetota bacterium]|nr:aminopeptidase P family protein [Spirochaetota bacterium]
MRIKKFRKLLREKGLFPCLVTDLNDIKYLTGYSGTNAALLIDAKKSFFISDSRYEEYICSILPPGFRFFLQKGGLADAVKDVFILTDNKALHVQAGLVTYVFFSELKKKLKGVKLIPLADDPVAELRLIKDDREIVIFRQAAGITDACFNHLLRFIKPGMTEWEVSIEIGLFYKKNGCRGCSFDSIVASGAGSSMPHYIPSMKKIIGKGDALLIDMGCVYEGYNSDLTRTVFVDKVDAELESVYNIVYRAQAKALAAVRPGIEARELDSVARSYIAEHGYGDNFGHGLGHGLGIEIHEAPAIKKNSSSSLKQNMVITVEPGIYIPGKGGVRIEDMVLVTADGPDVLTRCSKSLTVI